MSKHDKQPKPPKPAKPPKQVLPPAVANNGDLTFYADGTVSAQAFEDYFKSYTGPGTLIHNFFFADSDKVFPANPVQAANIAYNSANVWGPLGQFITSVDGMLQGFSCALVNGRFDSHSVVGLPYSRASREPVSSIPAILAAWRAQGYFPTVVEQTWSVV
jgi:hypothetical protein